VGTRAKYHLFLVSLAVWSGAAAVGLFTHTWLLLALPLTTWLIGWHRAIAGIFIVSLIAGGLLMAIRHQAISHNVVAPFLDRKVSVTMDLSVRSDPVLGQPKNEGGYIKPASTTALASAISLNVKGLRLSTHLPIRLTTSEHANWLPGTVVRCTGVLYSTAEQKVVGLLAVRGHCVVVHQADLLERTTGAIRLDLRFAAAKVRSDAGNLIPGLVLGDTSLESHRFVLAMLAAGLTHLTAVSGENFAIVAASLSWLLQWFISRLRVRLLISSVVLSGFIVLVRPSPSVLRAGVMVAIMVFSQARGSRASPLPALGLAISVLIFLNPFEATDPGFALSVAATAGIILFQQGIAQWLERLIAHPRFCEILAIPIAANILCLPVAVAISGQLSIVSLVTNVVVEPVIVPVTIIGCIAAIATPALPALGYALVYLIAPFSWWICEVAALGARVPVIPFAKGWLGAGAGAASLYLIWLVTRIRAWRSP